MSSIKVVSTLTGIPMGTLRMWERRHGFPMPARKADSNRRVYPIDQVRKLEAVARALSHGYRPSDVVDKPLADIEALLEEPARLLAPPERAAGTTGDVSRLLTLLVAEDIKGIEDELRFAAAALGAKRFVTELAQPLASAVGDAWAAGQLDIRHEHVMTECLTTQLRALLATHQSSDGAPTIILTTLPGEPHTLGLQMVALYLALSAAKPRLLGANTPPEQVLAAARSFGASVIGIAATPAADRTLTRRSIVQLCKRMPPALALWVGGGAAQRLGRLPDRAEWLGTWSEIDDALRRVRARSLR